jgi:hypothetical protein
MEVDLFATIAVRDCGMRKAIFLDPDGNAFGIGGGPA